MKTTRLLFTLLFVGVSATGFGQTSIVGSAHDLSARGWNASGEICIVCHTPHNAMDVTGDPAPLWNHRESTTATFTVYTTTGTLDATVGQPSGVSKLCLSCHDGSVGLSDFGGVTDGLNPISGNGLLGTDLSNDHPISFIYNSGLATSDGELFDPETDPSGITGTIEEDLLFGATLGSRTMECSSCHDVHGGVVDTQLLRKSNAASALCLTCHDK